MRRSTRILVVFLATAAIESSMFAVGIKETARLTISGPGLSQPLEVTDENTLAFSNVFAGTFIGEPAVNPPDAELPRYRIVFDIQTAEGVRAAAYTVLYCKDRWTGDAFVYVPGYGDDGYRRNIGTILREGQDGRWHRAATPWSQAINRHLP
jgi:hypothetical protein